MFRLDLIWVCLRCVGILGAFVCLWLLFIGLCFGGVSCLEVVGRLLLFVYGWCCSFAAA